MGEKLVIGPINSGLRNDRTAFVIDNDSFPTLINAYQWRGRIKRKRGTQFLGRLKRYFNSTNVSYNTGSTTFALVAGAGNILVNASWTLQVNGNIVPGSVVIINTTVAQTYTDVSADGSLSGNLGGTGTINYSTGAITITGGAGNSVSASFNYYPTLPVMGLEDFVINDTQFPSTIAFDTKYSYNVVTSSPYPIYDVSFYKNPATATYPGYTAKTNETPTTWNGQDYQQFWTVNYQGALWATNGINVPFSITNIGMQFKPIVTVTITTAGNGTTIPAVATLQITGHGLVIGDFLFINEVVTTTGINYQTGYVTAVTDANNVVVTFPFAILTTNGTGGIAQYLTNRSDTTKDCLRYYDGDPTNGNVNLPTLNGTKGWVNFAPPLSNSLFSIAERPPAIYYLVGARMIVPYKDRLLFLGPVIQSKSGSPLYLQDTIIYSQNGTPYYTASFFYKPTATSTDPSNASIVFNPILVPDNQTSSPVAYIEDITGFGGFISAGIDQPLITVGSNEDVLITGFSTTQAKLIFSGNDIVPFQFYLINSELGSGSTFSAINTDEGILTRGNRGYLITTQNECRRIDLVIPDIVFEIRLKDNGIERVCSQRDFINEWIYFTYTDDESNYKFPNQTLQYNYRDDTWAIFEESYTTYGSFKKNTGYTWQTIGTVFPTWGSWNEPWNAGVSNLLQPLVIAGNQQGFIVFRGLGTAESKSLTIKSISGNTITSPNHNLSEGDFIQISNVIGTIGMFLNGFVFEVTQSTIDTFVLDPNITGTGTYFGGGTITKLYAPTITTKQFPMSWDSAKKTRLGVQQYLLTKTANAQVQLLVYLSQNSESAYNEPELDPNESLVYSNVLYTCPESTNLGLTPANINLNMVTATSQQQIWHRLNTSLIGDTVQVSITLSDDQMLSYFDFIPAEITGATQAALCVLTCNGGFRVGSLVRITEVIGMIELNGNVYEVVASSSTTITLGVSSTGFTAYISGGIATLVSPYYQTAEIELHSIILDVSPSMLLA